MKLCTVLLAALPLLSGTMSDEEAAVSEAINKFSTGMYKELSEGTENLVVSPFSVEAVVSMLLLGLRGDTEKHVAQALYLPESRTQSAQGFKSMFSSLQASENVTLEVANKIYVQDGFHLKEEFLNDTRDYFNSVAEEVDIAGKTKEVTAAVNKWAAEKTHDKIQDLLTPDDLRNVVMILLNAIYFKGLWKNQFDKELTTPQPFHLLSGANKDVPIMNMEESFPYIELKDLNTQVLMLPYQGNRFGLLVFLPRELNGLKNLESNLDKLNIPDVLKSLRGRWVALKLPRFKILNTIDLGNTLVKLGLGELFSPGADFSGVTDANVLVSKALQKAFIEVNEEGTEAAAVTALLVAIESAIVAPPPEYFIADHPFLYMIVDTSRGTVLFMGRVTEPME